MNWLEFVWAHVKYVCTVLVLGSHHASGDDLWYLVFSGPQETWSEGRGAVLLGVS